MDPLIVDLYNKSLRSHSDLSSEDVTYATQLLVQSHDPLLLLHLDKGNYIGKFSPRFNQNIDNLIKSRNLESSILDPRMDLSILTPGEQTEFLYLENILLVTLINTINYIKLFPHKSDKLNSVFNDRLIDLCDEIGTSPEIFNSTIKIVQNVESGSILRVSHSTFMDLVDLLKNPKLVTPEILRKYNKEIKIIS